MERTLDQEEVHRLVLIGSGTRSKTTTALTPAGMTEAGPVEAETHEVGPTRTGDLLTMTHTMLITEGRHNMNLIPTHIRTQQNTTRGTIQVSDRWLCRSPPPLVLFLITGPIIIGDRAGREGLTGTGTGTEIGTEIGIGSPIQ